MFTQAVVAFVATMVYNPAGWFVKLIAAPVPEIIIPVEIPLSNNS